MLPRVECINPLPTSRVYTYIHRCIDCILHVYTYTPIRSVYIYMDHFLHIYIICIYPYIYSICMPAYVI